MQARRSGVVQVQALVTAGPGSSANRLAGRIALAPCGQATHTAAHPDTQSRNAWTSEPSWPCPWATLALSFSGSETLRQPPGWNSSASHDGANGPTHETGVAPETEASGLRALTVRSRGRRAPHEVGSIGQSLTGHAGQRLRLSAQVKSAAVDGWGGIAVASGWGPLHLTHLDPDFDAMQSLGAAGCTDWCEVSVVTDIPADSNGVVSVGVVLAGSGQVWARDIRLETVGRNVPLTTQRFGVEAAAAVRLQPPTELERARSSPQVDIHQRAVGRRAAVPEEPAWRCGRHARRSDSEPFHAPADAAVPAGVQRPRPSPLGSSWPPELGPAGHAAAEHDAQL
jgi:hypothetical protein